MARIISSQGSIQTLAIVASTCLLLSGGGYYGYEYYAASQEAPVVQSSPIAEIKKEVIVDTTSKEVLVSGIVGDVFVTTGSGDVLLKNEKIISMDRTIFYTTEDSRMSLIFADRSIVRLDSNTRVSLQKWTEWNIIVSVEKGRVWARIIGEAGWKWKLVISLGSSKAIIQGTSLEAVKMPLFSKYTVLDSSSASGSATSGIDVIDGSGVSTHVEPESKWVSTEFGTNAVKAINIKDIYENDPFALMNTQEDIVHLQDAIKNYSGSIDVVKAQKEILASIPTLWTEESISFFSGTTVNSSDLSGEISSEEWGKITQKVLTERMDEYTQTMKKNEVYLNQVLSDQEKLLDSIMKANGKMLDDTRQMVEGVVREQDILLSNIMMQNDDFIQKINQDVDTLMGEQGKMINTIMKDTMSNVDATIKNATQGVNTSYESVQVDGTVKTSSKEDVDSFQEQESAVKKANSSKNTQGNTSSTSIESDDMYMNSDDATTGNTLSNSSMKVGTNGMSNGSNTMSNDSDAMNMWN